MPRRCELGCPYQQGVAFHQFPHPERNFEGFKAWVHVVSGKLATADDIKLYRKKVICDVHFSNHLKNRNNRLNALAVPTLHLDDSTSSQLAPTTEPPLELSTSIPAVTGSDNISTKVSPTPQILLKSPTSMPTVTGSDNISTQVSPTPQPLLKPPKSIHIVAGSDNISTQVSPTPQKILKPPTSIPTVTGSLNNVSTQVFPIPLLKTSTSKSSVTGMSRAAAAVIAEHNYNKRQRMNAKVHNCTIPSQVLNKLQATKKEVKNLKAEIQRLRKRSETFKARLISAKKLSTLKCFQKVTRNMTDAAKIFTRMQFTQTEKKPGGRRFSLEEKVWSVSMYKRSPESYTLLAKYFTLPSAKSLKRLLAKVEVTLAQ